MNATETSIEAFHHLQNKETRQQQVLDILAKGPMCNRAIAKALRLPINQVTPRVHELRELGLVYQAYEDVDEETNRTVTVWARRGSV